MDWKFSLVVNLALASCIFCCPDISLSLFHIIVIRMTIVIIIIIRFLMEPLELSGSLALPIWLTWDHWSASEVGSGDTVDTTSRQLNKTASGRRRVGSLSGGVRGRQEFLGWSFRILTCTLQFLRSPKSACHQFHGPHKAILNMFVFDMIICPGKSCWLWEW